MATADYISYFTKSFLNQDTTSNLGKLWTLFSTQLDEIEAQVTLLKAILSITGNSGKVLDAIGNLVCQTRAGGEADIDYRLDLMVAIMSKISGGTIPELVSIGKIVAGNDANAVFRPWEMWQGDGTAYFDASDIMDGHGFFTPETGEPAAVECHIEGDVDNIEAPLTVGTAIDKVRGAGIYAKYRITFYKNASDMTLYSGVMANASSIALGDGATRDPLPADTGLENEVYRETVGFSTSVSGDPQYTVYVFEDELNAYTINEMALFDSAGTMIVKHRFDGKAKNSSMMYEYRVIDDIS